MIIGVVAVDINYAIGKNGNLGWNCPADLLMFKKLTTFAKKNIVVFGRKTAEKFNAPLKDRLNVILTRDVNYSKEGFEVVHDVESVLKMNESDPINTCIAICGGAEVYKLFSNYISTLYINYLETEIINPDTFFPIEECGFGLSFEYFRSVEAIKQGCCKESGIHWRLLKYIRLISNTYCHCHECHGKGVLRQYTFAPMCEACNGTGNIIVN